MLRWLMFDACSADRVTKMSLINKIRNIYPSLTEDDFDLAGTIKLYDKNDGSGPFIQKWSHPTLARPTDAQLASASDVWTPPQQTTAEKLAAAGLTIDELKALLGLH